MFKKLFLFAICSTIFMSLSYANTHEQATHQGQAAAPAQGAPDAEMVQKYKKVRPEVDKLSQKYADKLNSVSEPEKAKQIQEEYRSKVIGLIRKEGMTIEQFNQMTGM